MFKKYGVAFTSGSTIDGKINVSKTCVIKMYFDKFNQYIMSYVNHDRTRPIGYCNNDMLYFGFNNVQVTVKFNQLENDEDNQKLIEVIDLITEEKNKNVDRTQYNQLFEKVQRHIIDRVEYLGDFPAIALYNEGILDRLFPKEKISEELIDIKKLQLSKNGSFILGDYIVYPHKYFRRSQSIANTINEEFVSQLVKLAEDDSLSVTIALDSNIVGLPGTDCKEMEFQYWWGPKFKDDLDIKYGVTVHNNDDQNKRAYSRVLKTEFRWYEQDDKKTFECEELVEYTHQIDGEPYVPNRFIHSMLNDNNEPFHIDGALRNYQIEQYEDRLKTKLDKTGRDTLYKKIFRIDGVISVNQWKNLVTHYFRDNSLVGEYLGGNDEILLNQLKKKDEIIEDKFDGFKIDDGIRMAFKLYNASDINLSNDSLALITDSTNGDLSILDKYFYNQFKNQDMVITNFEETSMENGLFRGASVYILKTDNHINKFNAILPNIPIILEDEKTISFSIGYQIEDKLVLLGFIGCAKKFRNIKKLLYKFPNNINQCSDWLIQMDSRNISISKGTNERVGDIIEMSRL